MGLTLDELKLIEKALHYLDRNDHRASLVLIKREIKLKEMNPVTGEKYIITNCEITQDIKNAKEN